MSLIAFQSISFIRQVAVTIQDANFITARSNAGNIFELYGYNGFYIELCKEELTGKIILVNSFYTGDQLEPYLSKISIDYENLSNS